MCRRMGQGLSDHVVVKRFLLRVVVDQRGLQAGVAQEALDMGRYFAAVRTDQRNHRGGF